MFTPIWLHLHCYTRSGISLAIKVKVEVTHNYTGSMFAEKGIKNGDKTAVMYSVEKVTKVTISVYGYISKNVLIKLYTKLKCQCQVRDINEIDFVSDS